MAERLKGAMSESLYPVREDEAVEAVTVNYWSYCQHCVWRRGEKAEMLTGYCLKSLNCDKCGRVSDLALVRELER